jgi:hypothetical protein
VLELDPGIASLKSMFPASRSDGPNAPNALDANDLDSRVDPDVYRARWGKFAGREEEFFRECATRVASLRWRDVRSVCGPEVRLFERVTRDAYEALVSDELPEWLKLGEFEVVEMDAEYARVRTYSPYDPIVIPRVLLDVLHEFDGKRPVSARRVLAQKHGIDVERALVLRLVDFAVLVPGATRPTRTRRRG